MALTGPDHDYDPSWDYDVVEAPPAATSMLERLTPLIRQEVLPALFIADYRVFFVDGLDGDIARFVSGTGTYPYVLIDYRELEDACDHIGLDVEHQLAASIAHELAHAAQENMGVEEHDETHEDEAERFASLWVTSGVADPNCLSDEREAA